MISIQQIQYILTLSEEKQFQKASERCFVTQPTLSMQVKKAEQMLGGQLFDRSRNPLELTPFGNELLPIFRDVIADYSNIEDVILKKDGIYKEEIKMAIIPTIAGYMVPELYNEWKKALPNVQLTIVELKTEEILKSLEDRKIDIGILAGPVLNPKWRTIPLYSEEIKAFLPSKKGAAIKLDELVNEHPWLLTKGNCLRTQMMHFCQLKSGEGKDDWDYEGGNISLLENMVLINGGYTLVPENYIKKNEKDYKRIFSSANEIPAREVISLVPNKSPKIKFLEAIIRKIQLEYNKGTSDDALSILNWE
tara:strand:- start:964 stop:1884 length:921 start_codon:yes stop_codon:yes gene_type:complete